MFHPLNTAAVATYCSSYLKRTAAVPIALNTYRWAYCCISIKRTADRLHLLVLLRRIYCWTYCSPDLVQLHGSRTHTAGNIAPINDDRSGGPFTPNIVLYLLLNADACVY